MPQRVAVIDARGTRVSCEQGSPAARPAEAAQVGVADAAVRGGGCLPELIGQREQFIWPLIIRVR